MYSTVDLAKNAISFKDLAEFEKVLQKIKQDLPQLKKLFVNGNNFEQEITGYQTYIIRVFGDRLEELDGVDLDDIEVADLRYNENEKRDRQMNMEEDDDDSMQDEMEGRKMAGAYLSKMTEDVEKSLRVPSQANNNLTELKRKAQILSLSKGNVFNDDISVIVIPINSFSTTTSRASLKRSSSWSKTRTARKTSSSKSSVYSPKSPRQAS